VLRGVALEAVDGQRRRSQERPQDQMQLGDHGGWGLGSIVLLLK
jgi:hypothetical protein